MDIRQTTKILSSRRERGEFKIFVSIEYILLSFLRSLREISFMLFQVSLTSLTGILGRNAVFMSPQPLSSRKSGTINSYLSIDIFCGTAVVLRKT